MIKSRVRDASPCVLSVIFCRSTRGSEEGRAVQRASRQRLRTTGCTLSCGAASVGSPRATAADGSDICPLGRWTEDNGDHHWHFGQWCTTVFGLSKFASGVPLGKELIVIRFL